MLYKSVVLHGGYSYDGIENYRIPDHVWMSFLLPSMYSILFPYFVGYIWPEYKVIKHYSKWVLRWFWILSFFSPRFPVMICCRWNFVAIAVWALEERIVIYIVVECELRKGERTEFLRKKGVGQRERESRCRWELYLPPALTLISCSVYSSSMKRKLYVSPILRLIFNRLQGVYPRR